MIKIPVLKQTHTLNPAAKMSWCQQPQQHLGRKAETEADFQHIAAFSRQVASGSLSHRERVWKVCELTEQVVLSVYAHTRAHTKAQAGALMPRSLIRTVTHFCLGCSHFLKIIFLTNQMTPLDCHNCTKKKKKNYPPTDQHKAAPLNPSFPSPS